MTCEEFRTFVMTRDKETTRMHTGRTGGIHWACIWLRKMHVPGAHIL